MRCKCLVLCALLILILQTLTCSSNSSIFDKFNQNDYKLKFERLELVSFNKDVMKRFDIVTFKYNRTCPVANMTVEFVVDVSDKLELVVQTYKFMSNEYRFFPISFQTNVCFAVDKNLAGMGRFNNYCGNFTGCPFPKKNTIIRVCNWTPDESRLPPFIPNGRYMLELQMLYGSIEAGVFRALGEVYRPII